MIMIPPKTSIIKDKILFWKEYSIKPLKIKTSPYIKEIKEVVFISFFLLIIWIKSYVQIEVQKKLI
ncbi:MAG: hypothetical protein WC688_03150 [Parachlamydiales bacterium]